MVRDYGEMRAQAAAMGPVPVSVAAADDRSVVRAVKIAVEMGMIRPILAGREDKIRALLEEEGLRVESYLTKPFDLQQFLSVVKSLRRFLLDDVILPH